jgi:rhodanese-related sulfurtransferase
MIKRALKRGLKAARTAKEMGKGLILGAPGVGHGVAEYEDFEKIRREAAQRDAAEGIRADDGAEFEAISGGTREISAEDLRILLEVEQPEDHPLILDVRQLREWAEGHLVGALHVPLGDLEHRLAELPLENGVVTYCASGMRSIDASYILKRHGVEDVRSLAGGIHAWERAGSPIARD